MRRLVSFGALGMILIALMLTLMYARGRTQNSNQRSTKIQNTNVSATEATDAGRMPRKGKPLVRRLPAKVEGIEIKDNMVMLKPGYKLDKKDDGTTSIARMSGGGITGSFDCACDDFKNPKGTCTVETGGNGLGCSNGTCKDCTLYITIGKVASKLMMY